MAIVVLGIAIPPLVSMFRIVARNSVDETFQDVALAYANGLMEEIASKGFEDPDLSTGSFGTEEGTRSSYDDVDDFDGLSNSPPEQLDGTDLDEFGGFTRSVVVENVTSADPDATTPQTDGSTDLKRIEVTVAWTGGRGGELVLSTLSTLIQAEEGEGGETGGPLDEVASAATADNGEGKSFNITLINETPDDIEIQSFSLAASRSVPDIKKFELATTSGNWTQIWGDQVSLPTGTENTNGGSSSERKVLGDDSAGAYFEFDGDISSGAITFTLVLNFTDGSSSTLDIDMTW